MKREEIESAIQEQLAKRGKKALNRNAVEALFGSFENPISALGKIFVGRKDALEREEGRIRQEVILDLLCRLDEAFTDAQQKATSAGIRWTEVSGKIEAIGVDTEEVVALNIAATAGPVEIKPGTHIVALATGAKRAVGLNIGGREKGGD